MPGGGEGLIQEPGEASAEQCGTVRTGNQLTQEGADLAVVAADEAVDAEVQGLGLVELEELRHQGDEAGLGRGPGGVPGVGLTNGSWGRVAGDHSD